MKSLSDKTFLHDEMIVLSPLDVKESIKRVWNKKRKEKGCKEGQEVITAEDFFEEFGIGFLVSKNGKELCSEEDLE